MIWRGRPKNSGPPGVVLRISAFRAIPTDQRVVTKRDRIVSPSSAVGPTSGESTHSRSGGEGTDPGQTTASEHRRLIDTRLRGKYNSVVYNTLIVLRLSARPCRT